MTEGNIARNLCILVSLIFLTSGFVDIHFLRHVPRLSNTSYWDTYFRCCVVGETLQWQVSNKSLDRYQRQNVALVLTGNVSNFSYFATLLYAQTISENEFRFDSILIVTSLSNSSVDVACSNGSLSAIVVNEASGTDIEETAITSSIFLEYILTDEKDDSKHTSIFICGVDNNFMKLQVNEDDDKSFLFSHFDNVGDERRLPQDIDTTIEQQAILIGQNTLYELVTVMFVIHDLPVTIACGYNQNSVNITSRQPMMTTEISEISEITKSLTTSMDTSMPQGSTTRSTGNGGSMSTKMGNKTNIDAAVSVSIILFVLFCIAIIIIFCCWSRLKECCRRNRPKLIQKMTDGNEKTIDTKSEENKERVDRGTEVPLRNYEQDNEPLKIVQLDAFKGKHKEEDFDYKSYCEKVMYIITIVREDVLNAAATFFLAPEEGSENITKIDNDVYIGRIEDHAVGLIKHVRESKGAEFVKKTIMKYFPNTKYLVSMGLCYTFDCEVANMGDVLISDNLIVYGEEKGEEKKSNIITDEVEMTNEIKSIFEPTEGDNTGLQVTISRKSRHIKGNIGSCLSIKESTYLEPIAGFENACGVEKVAGLFASLQTDGITMQDGTNKKIPIIAIKAVFGYGSGEEDKDWIFMSCQAVLHYVRTKICASDKRPLKVNIIQLNECKHKHEGFDYEAYCKKVSYIITIVREDVLNAAATFFLAPEEGSENITKIDNDVYIGKIGDHAVGLIKHVRESKGAKFVKETIMKYFSNTKYLVSMGLCYTLDRKVANMGDVLISDNLIVYSEKKGEGNKKKIISKDEVNMTNEIKSIFEPTEGDDTGLQVTISRKSRHIKGNISSCLSLKESTYLKIIAGFENACGVEKVAGLFASLQRDGITMQDGTNRKIPIIAIKAVFGYGNGEENKDWIFMSGQAVLHYVRTKICASVF